MAIGAVGLTTHIMNNHVKSVLLLMGFPLLLILMIGAFCASFDAVMQSSRGYHATNALSSVANVQLHALENTKRAYDIISDVGAYGEPRPDDRPLATRPVSPPPPADGSISWGRAMDAGWYGMLRYGHFAIAAASIWFLIAWFFHTRLMQAATGSRPVTRQQMPKIYNMLENLCISRGIAMPQFEIIDSPALNAFAAGINEKTYRIVLTRGLVESLRDDELEAVIAHELTHIINRDVRLLIISVIFVGMISFFAEMAFRTLLHGTRPNFYLRRSGNSRDGNGALIMLLIGVAILAIGYFFAIGIRFALSRKREYLADAGAVELTKNPEGMMRALLRISGRDKVAAMPDEVQQMCIENSHQFMGMFATHPPIDKRIRAISQMTGTPIPELPVTLRRPPSQPWSAGIAPVEIPTPREPAPGKLFPDPEPGQNNGPWNR